MKWATFCPKFKETQKAKKAATEDSATMKSIRMTVRAVSINKAELLDLDDCAPTPICDMQFETENGNKQKMEIFSNMKCYLIPAAARVWSASTSPKPMGCR